MEEIERYGEKLSEAISSESKIFCRTLHWSIPCSAYEQPFINPVPAWPIVFTRDGKIVFPAAASEENVLCSLLPACQYSQCGGGGQLAGYRVLRNVLRPHLSLSGAFSFRCFLHYVLGAGGDGDGATRPHTPTGLKQKKTGLAGGADWRNQVEPAHRIKTSFYLVLSGGAGLKSRP